MEKRRSLFLHGFYILVIPSMNDFLLHSLTDEMVAGLWWLGGVADMACQYLPNISK